MNYLDMTGKGWKTYTAAGIVALVSFATAVGWVNQTQAMALLAAANAVGLVGIRHAVGKPVQDPYPDL